MLRMPEFEVHTPSTVADAVYLRASLPASMYVAGGTDLLVNLKHRLHAPSHLVSLLAIPELRGIALAADGTLRIGSGTTLHEVATSEMVLREAPGLALAASLVAGPQHRRMGTIGGNVMLDTRCLFYNQTEDWRRGIGYCLKASGDWCHVMGTPKGCVAAQSSDTVPVLAALGASVELEQESGTTRTALDALFTKDGRFEEVHTVSHAALVTAITIPPRAAGHRSTYRKVRARQAVDYPQLGVAVVGSFSADVAQELRIVVGAVLPQPRVIEIESPGQLSEEKIASIAEHVFKQVKPQTSVHGSPEWRRHMARVETRRALEQLALADATAR
jgi:4-hydroxybenzoyl-CoA reductase subunit beta